MRAFTTLCLSIGLTIVALNVGVAQDRNDLRRQFIEGVLKSLVESQLERDPHPHNRPPNRPQSRNPQLAASLQTLERFSGETDQLVKALRREERVNPAYRSLLGDAIRVKANTEVLLRRGAVTDLPQFSNDYREIDRQWRILAHRLRQIPGVDRECLACVDKLNVYDQQICELLNLTPQLDRLELSRHVAELQFGLRALVEDLTDGLRRQPGRSTLLLEGQRLLAHVDVLGRIVQQNATHQVVVGEYLKIYRGWRALAKQVRFSGDPFTIRRLRRIEETHDAIHNLLWIPKTIDRDELISLVNSLQREINQVQHGITLDHLVEHSQPQEVVASALTLNKACVSLSSSLAGQTKLDDLVWDFRVLEVEWQEAAAQLRSWSETELDQRIAVAQRTMDILSQTLGQELTIDQEQIVTLAAAIHVGADSLAAQTVRLANSSNQYPSPFRVSSQSAARRFQDAARHLHESVARRADPEHLKRDCLELASSWGAAQQMIEGFAPQDRAVLNSICHPLGPHIAKMQILYGY